MEFAVISDTHWREPNPELERLLHRLVGAKYILHAGDVVSPAILDALAQVAPVLAVIGNCCGAGLRAGARVVVATDPLIRGVSKLGMTSRPITDCSLPRPSSSGLFHCVSPVAEL